LAYDRKTLDLFLTHRADLVDYAAAIVGCRSRAEDVVQEAYLRFDDVAERRELAEPVGYLFRIVRNLALDWARRLRLEGRLGAPETAIEATPTDRPSPEDEALHKDELRIVRAALAELPERTRHALELHRFGGLKLKEIAERLGISTTLAHGLVFQALDHCRRRLRQSAR